MKWILATGLAALLTCLPSNPEAQITPGGIDFGYAPRWWQTAVCMPDDPEKAIVGKEGQFLFDFGGGGFRNFGISAQPEIAGGTKWERQQTASARAPIVQTWKDADGVHVLEEAFMALPKPPKASPRGGFTRVDGEERLQEWATPARPCVPAFSGIDVGWGQEIRLRLAVPKGSRTTLAFGLCEGFHKEPGRRPLVLSAEGAEAKTVDPVKDFGANQPGIYRLVAQDVNRDGMIDVGVAPSPDATDRNPILNCLWAFSGPVPSDESILQGPSSAYAFYAGTPPPERRVVILVTLKNETGAAATRQPFLRIQSVQGASVATGGGSVVIGSRTRISASDPIESCEPAAGNDLAMKLTPVTLAPGASRQLAFTIDRNSAAAPALHAAEAVALRDAVRAWWEKADLPFDTIHVPDPSVQAMLESCVRNIWQAREIKGGKPAFQVGPTYYRGLWVVDGAFILESAALLGRTKEARGGIDYLLRHQRPDGSFELLGRYWKENGIVLWILTRHAQLTQDKGWLRSKWPAFQRVVQAIQRLRTEASQDPQELNYRLLPGGQIDGGIVNDSRPEFSNTEWCLAGLKAAVAAAHWLGFEKDAAAWQKEYADFYGVFRKAAERDMLKDTFGNAYMPAMMANAGAYTPQKGQWTFCHAIYPGQIFAPDEPFAVSQMAMLRATKVEGMIYDTGWIKDGIWSYATSFYAHAALWQGHGREAAEMLIDFGRHASPTRVWREEQKPVGKGDDEVGDMPHNWASAEFIRLTTHLLEMDRGDELHLFEGLPASWVRPGMETRLNGVATPFGPLVLTLRVSRDGRSARLQVNSLRASKIVVHLGGWAKGADNATITLPGGKAVDRVIPLTG